MEAEIQATFEHCGSFNSKLKDTLTSLLNANNDRKAEIDGLRSDHDALQQAHDAFQGRDSTDIFLKTTMYHAFLGLFFDWYYADNGKKENSRLCDPAFWLLLGQVHAT